jgi:hypothetical protein
MTDQQKREITAELSGSSDRMQRGSFHFTTIVFDENQPVCSH